MKTLIVIPSRGGSKGIPRKNLRSLAGKPLIYYSIQNALSLKGDIDVYVSSDDKEILFFAEKFGAKTFLRSNQNATDAATLDPVIFEAYEAIQKLENKVYDLIITMQATSPLLSTSSIQNAIGQISDNKEIDTIISCVNDTHLSWGKVEGKFMPLYEKRLNRQYLPPQYKETGGFLITRKSIITSNNRIGKNVSLFELKEEEAIDIDTYADWNLCEYYLKHKTIVFSLIGNSEIGLGHVYNSITLASQILNHRVVFVFEPGNELGYEKVKEQNYEAYISTSADDVNLIMSFNPDLVINDRLDTDLEYMQNLKSKGVKTLNIEDLGSGIALADKVVNAIYPDEYSSDANHYYGPKYFCIRDEFYLSQPVDVKNDVKNVLLSFGGVDPNNLTKKVLDAIYEYSLSNKIHLTVILGLGYQFNDSLSDYSEIEIYKNVSSMSDFMMKADVAFTSAGRTTYELACLGVPSIVLAQNEREMTHFFADENHGFKNLGLGKLVNNDEILSEFIELASNKQLRESMQLKMLHNDIRSGRDIVLKMINNLLATS